MRQFGAIGERSAWGAPGSGACAVAKRSHQASVDPVNQPPIPVAPRFGLGGILEPSWWPTFVAHHGGPGPVRDNAALAAAFGAQADQFGTAWESPALDFGKFSIDDHKLWELKATLVSRTLTGPRRVIRLLVFPHDAPFQLVSPPASVVLSKDNPRASFSICVSTAKARGECCCKMAFLVAEVEHASVDPSGSLWNIQRAAVGCQLLVEFTKEGKASLQVSSEPFLPLEFKKEFDMTPSSLHLEGAGGLDLDFIPAAFRNLLEQGEPQEDPLDIVFQGPPQPVPPVAQASSQSPVSGYKDCFWYALLLEGHQMHRDMEAHDMTSLKIDVLRTDEKHVFVRLPVPGLLEGRPAPSRSDLVRLRQSQQTGVEILARVHEQDTRRSCLILRTPASATEVLVNPKARFHVRFTVGQHYQALQNMLEAVKRTTGTLLARLNSCGSGPAQTESRTFSPLFHDLNNEQQLAVERCVSPISQNEPLFLINGPPGTGKTKTIASAILQYILMQPNGRVLAVAPSNSAADVLLIRLLEIARQHTSTKKLLAAKPFLRLNSYTRHVNEARGETLSCCLQEGDFFTMPTLAQIRSAKVVISTCTTTSYLDKAGLPHGFFDLIAFDEAAQALETETLVPLRLATSMTRIVLCGDPQQLGPQVRSTVAARMGLGVSMMERLLKMRTQSGIDYFTLHLVRNYRSHETLLTLPSRMFYNDSLIPCSDRARSSSLENWPELPRPGLPLWFWSIESSETIPDLRAPSLVNMKEVEAVKEVAARLTSQGYAAQAEIGVIAPYRHQVVKIRQRLRESDLGTVKVGTVNDYQGQEEKIVIVTTTLTTKKSLGREARADCGLTGNPKKFNVTTTRAEALLIVIGSANILAMDACWSKFLDFCRSNGCWTGPGLTDDLAHSVSSVTVGSTEEAEAPDSGALLGKDLVCNLNSQSSELAWLKRD